MNGQHAWIAITGIAQAIVLVLMLRIRAQVTKLHNKIHNDLQKMQTIDWTIAHELATATETGHLPPRTVQALHDLAELKRSLTPHDQAEPARTTTHHSPIDTGLTPCCGRTPFELPRTDQMTTRADLVTCRWLSRPPATTPNQAH